MGGVDKEITVFFSDIRGFTSMSEAVSPQELVNHLNIGIDLIDELVDKWNVNVEGFITGGKGADVSCEMWVR